jgi:hypothetical protein
LCTEFDLSLPIERVTPALKKIASGDGTLVIRCDTGPDKVSGVLKNRAALPGIAFLYIPRGELQQNGDLESFNDATRRA